MSDFSTQLLDAAKAVTGSDYKTAKALEITTQQISNWRNKRASLPVADVVLLADLAGLKAEEWAARAIVQKYEGTPKGDKLFRALGKVLVATGGAVASFGANAHQIFGPDGNGNIVSYFIRCIEVLTRKRVSYS